MLKEMATLAQLYRDLQLKNVYLMENTDEQIDRIFEIKANIEFLKREIIAVRKRQLSFLSELFELYKTKDREIDFLSMSLQMITKEREIVEKRRDESFSSLIDLLAERRRILGVV